MCKFPAFCEWIDCGEGFPHCAATMADVGDSELLPRLNMTKLEKPKAKAKVR